jgi:hypothetical protein
VKNTISFLLLFVFILVRFGIAQDSKPEMISDRPDQTESPYLIPQGALQVESGSFFERNHDGNTTIFNVGFKSTLIRYGVNDNLELRLISEYLGEYVDASETLSNREGRGPITLGVKLKLAKQNGAWPQTGLISHIKLRAGSKGFSKSYTATSIRVAFSNTLNDKWTLDYNAGLEWNGESPEAIFLGSVSLSYLIATKLTGFVEGYSFFPEDGLADTRFDSGLMYKLTSTVQLDVMGGFGLCKIAPDYFLATGVSMRFLK